jgi:hypothetical protein
LGKGRIFVGLGQGDRNHVPQTSNELNCGDFSDFMA